MEKMLCLAAGSLVGGFARWLASDFAGGSRFPFGTLLVNLSGCLLIGVLHGLGDARLSGNGRMLLMIGFCGAFTTFSTWMLEASSMLDRADSRGALAYVMASVVLGFVLLRAGSFAARALAGSQEPPLAAAGQRDVSLS